MNEYPAVMEEAQEKNEQLSVYRNYNKDIKAVIIKAILTVMFLYFFISLLAGVIVNTPGFGYNLNQIVVKYEYIAEGVPISYVMESVNFVYDLVIDYILLFCCIINTARWCEMFAVFKSFYSTFT